MICDRQLKKMSGNAFVTENWPRVFDRGADVKVAALRIVRRNEIKSRRIGIVNSRRIHEAAGTRRFESFGQLTNLEPAHVRGNRHEMIRAKKISELFESYFV